MAEVERRRADVPATAQTGAELENLPTLFGKLGRTLEFVGRLE